jgi:hypothetical protein
MILQRQDHPVPGAIVTTMTTRQRVYGTIPMIARRAALDVPAWAALIVGQDAVDR